RLAEKKVPVVLRINFPEEPKTGGPAARSGREGGPRTVTPELIAQMRERGAAPDVIERMEQRLAEQKRDSDTEKKGEEKGETEKAEQEKKAAETKRKLPESPRLIAENKRLWAEQVACAAV